MSRNGLGVRIYRYQHTDFNDTPVYQVTDRNYRLYFVDSAQAAFDYCAEHYPGEAVTVEIKP